MLTLREQVEGLGAPEKPAYFRYLTLMAFHVFLQEKVRLPFGQPSLLLIAVRTRSTLLSSKSELEEPTTRPTSFPNPSLLVSPPSASTISLSSARRFRRLRLRRAASTRCAFLSIAFARLRLFFQPGVPALAIDQPGESLDVLRSRATELHASSFSVVPTHPSLLSIPLGLAGAHQRTNASLAIALVQAFLSSPRLPPAFAANAISLPSPLSTEEGMPELPLEVIAPELLGEKMVQGLKATNWPGRCQIAKDATKTEIGRAHV